jgi:hypothetical protein
LELKNVKGEQEKRKKFTREKMIKEEKQMKKVP